MQELSKLFDSTVLLLPRSFFISRSGEIPLKGHNLSVMPLTHFFERGILRRALLPFWLLYNGLTLIRETLRADAVHAPIPSDLGTIGMFLAFLFRKPLFVRYCGNWFAPRTPAERFWRWFMETFAGGRNVMLATGGSSQPPSQANPAISWIFATSLTEGDLKIAAPLTTRTLKKEVRLIIVCRQEREKGSGVLIKSLPIILKDFSGTTLDIVGDGIALRELKKLAAALKVSEQVIFHGKVGHNRVIQLLKAADIFCYPTRASEGFPKTVLEALACGLPVVTTAISVLPQLIKRGCGLLIEEPTPIALAKAVKGILSDREAYRAMSIQAIETARQYTLGQWRNEIGELLENAWGPLQTSYKENMSIPKKLEDLRIDFLAGTLGLGGAERQLYYMAKVLSGAGVRVRVISLTSGEAYEKDLEKLGISIIRVGRFHSRIIRLYNIIRELRKDPPDIIYSAHFYTNFYATIAARVTGVKEIGAIRSDLSDALKKPAFLARWNLVFPRFLIANSRKAIEGAIEHGVNPDSICLLENVVDTEQFRPGPERGNRPGSDSAVRIICVGRFTNQKRIDVFLHAFSELQQLTSGMRAKIIGEGDLRRPLEDLSRQLHLGPDRVEFIGKVEDMASLYQQADILVLTSDFEGMPNVVLEAMAAGLPVISTNVGAVPDIISNCHTGYILPVGDTNGFAHYILRLVRNSQLRRKMGKAGRALVENSFSLNRLEQRLFSLYTSVLKVR